MEKQTALNEVIQAMKQAKERRMYECYQADETGGLTALQMNHSPGAPTRLSEEQQEKLKQTIVNSVPHEVGFTARHNWTLEIIAAFIEREFGYRYSLRGVSKMMHRQGLSYTKPTYTLAAADPKKQRQFVENTFPTLKKDS